MGSRDPAQIIPAGAALTFLTGACHQRGDSSPLPGQPLTDMEEPGSVSCYCFEDRKFPSMELFQPKDREKGQQDSNISRALDGDSASHDH